MTKLFTPSSEMLMSMIKAAEAKCDASIEQAKLRKAAQEEARMERFLIAQAAAQRWKRLHA